ncbi:related to metaphase-anaphase transition protein (Mlo2) [Cephalotrichum gorgonifer]|uniref:Related to metaphase-anaphase transition protein (Mlo2) n=1 Tax=Cephalotrichum gorgonifer TaxID=2041049 RepID=A0AAE8MSX4_9PEZI|nr:related to metaphase-anaphase transition protein (Mlo2) [Cephalotrichum gorgonifer]
MDPPPPQPTQPQTGDAPVDQKPRTESVSAQSNESQTAADFLRDQLQLEADAREAMPYAFDSCTYLLGPLKQSVFSCLTCNPIPKDDSTPYEAAGVCYACSIQCHGDHTLVEIFAKRNFTCDCGTTRLPATSPCTIRANPDTGAKGVHSEKPFADSPPNVYNQNFRNRFCLCSCDYDPFQQKGTMFQCLGLGTHLTGGCGEDWFHPGCLTGLGPNWYEKANGKQEDTKVKTEGTGEEGEDEAEDPPMPAGFPDEDDFEGFFCYKCVESNPWIKRYAGSRGFLKPVFFEGGATSTTSVTAPAATAAADSPIPATGSDGDGKKRKASELGVDETVGQGPDKRPKSSADSDCKLDRLPAPPAGKFNLFFKPDFRNELCQCTKCATYLDTFPQLREEEEIYEPPMSEEGSEAGGAASTHGSGSIYERGESALKNIDRVRAIEGVMAYNMMKEKLKPLFEAFAGTGKAIGADDIKDYFARLRGDDEAIRDAGSAAAASRDAGGDGAGAGGGREQSGY